MESLSAEPDDEDHVDPGSLVPYSSGGSHFRDCPRDTLPTGLNVLTTAMWERDNKSRLVAS